MGACRDKSMIRYMKLISKYKRLLSGSVIFVLSHVLQHSTDLFCILTAPFYAVKQRNTSISSCSRGQDLPQSHMDNSEYRQRVTINSTDLAGFETQQEM